MDTGGNDVTQAKAHIFSSSLKASWETDLATAEFFEIVVNDQQNELVADEAYVFVMVVAYVNPVDPNNPVVKMTTTIFAVMAEMEPLIDVTPYAAMIDTYLALVDPFIEKYFYHGLVASFSIFGFVIPAIITSG
jgi:hypothetical protein